MEYFGPQYCEIFIRAGIISPELLTILTSLIPTFLGLGIITWLVFWRCKDLAVYMLATFMILEGIVHVLWHTQAWSVEVVQGFLQWSWIVYVLFVLSILYQYRLFKSKSGGAMLWLMLAFLLAAVFLTLTIPNACSNFPIGPHFVSHVLFGLAGFLAAILMFKLKKYIE